MADENEAEEAGYSADDAKRSHDAFEGMVDGLRIIYLDGQARIRADCAALMMTHLFAQLDMTLAEAYLSLYRFVMKSERPELITPAHVLLALLKASGGAETKFAGYYKNGKYYRDPNFDGSSLDPAGKPGVEGHAFDVATPEVPIPERVDPEEN